MGESPYTLLQNLLYKTHRGSEIMGLHGGSSFNPLLRGKPHFQLVM